MTRLDLARYLDMNLPTRVYVFAQDLLRRFVELGAPFSTVPSDFARLYMHAYREHARDFWAVIPFGLDIARTAQKLGKLDKFNEVKDGIPSRIAGGYGQASFREVYGRLAREAESGSVRFLFSEEGRVLIVQSESRRNDAFEPKVELEVSDAMTPFGFDCPECAGGFRFFPEHSFAERCPVCNPEKIGRA